MLAKGRSGNGHAGGNGHSNGNGSAAASAPPKDPPVHAFPPEPSNADPPGFPNDALTGGLVQVGLTVHEAQMYHTLLRHGPSTARFAIQQSRLDRATGYRILSRLRARGLVTATGYRPQRFVALDATRLLDRVTTILRDELDIHRVVREIYAAGLPPARDLAATASGRPAMPGPEPPRPANLSLAARYRLLPGHDQVTRFMIDSLSKAREDVGALLRPATVPEPLRAALGEAIQHCVARGVRVRIVLDYHPADLEFLTVILRGIPDPSPTFEVRFYAPQLARLFLIDRRSALRCLVNPGSLPHTLPTLGVVSEDLEFVRVQSGRFQTTWREAVPLETALRSPLGSVLAPPSSSPELRHWVERPGRAEARGFAGDALTQFGWRVLRH